MPKAYQGIKNDISSKWKESKSSDSNFKLGTFVSSLFIGFSRFLFARFYLRNCALGEWVSVNGKPMVRSYGNIVLGNRVRVWSIYSKAKLLTRKDSEIIIGDNSRINGAHISASKSITIGKNVRIAPYTIIIDNDSHSISDHFQSGASGSIVIEDNVWIAVGCTILKGVHIGEGAVVAAGSVVTKNVMKNSVYGGNPAKFIKKTN